MHQYARRYASIFLTLFGVLVGGIVAALSTLKGEGYQGLVITPLIFLALICLGIGMWSAYYDLKFTLLRDHLRGYVIDMERLLDNPSDYNNQQEFTLLEYRITAFIEIKTPTESRLWNRPLQDCPTLADKIEKRISMLKSIIKKYESAS
jgi:hypothetical protein